MRHFAKSPWPLRHLQAMRYKTIRDAILTCARKPTRVSLIYRTETTTKKWKTEKLNSKKTDMLRSIGKQSAESVESVLAKKRKATVGRICRKGRFSAWNERVSGWWMMRVVSRWNRWRKCHSYRTGWVRIENIFNFFFIFYLNIGGRGRYPLICRKISTMNTCMIKNNTK